MSHDHPLNQGDRAFVSVAIFYGKEPMEWHAAHLTLWERERERERESERERDAHTNIQTDRQTQIDGQRRTERGGRWMDRQRDDGKKDGLVITYVHTYILYKHTHVVYCFRSFRSRERLG